MMASFQRSNSHDKVRRIVAEEGRTARNLIAWSVPLESKDDDGKSKCQTGGKSKRTIQGTHKTSKQNTTVDCKMTSSAAGDKHFDKSPTKTRHPRKVDLRARYWAFLFDNLRRAVDEIYVTCESDQSVVECKEVLMMLDNYVRDFKALIDWIQLQEKLEKTDAQSRPTSLAWEVKKMSPGRHVIPSPSTDRINVTSNARRSLNFGGSSGTVAAPRLAPTGVSWADKVKAHHTGSTASSDVAPAPSCPPVAVQKPSRRNERKDAEGWETVQRGRPVRSRSTAVMPKASLPTEALRSKDDSDKENVHLLPDESIQKSEFVGDEPSNTIESQPKDPVHSCDHPLAERTQFTVSTLDDVKNSGSSFLPDNSVQTSEIPAVHIDTECVSVIQQADTPSLQASEDKFSAEKARIESEMDPSDISTQGVNNVPKRYSLAVGPPKKDPKVKGVQSAAVQAFLRRKEEELRRKALEEKRRKEELVKKRIELKHDKKARAMAKRTKDNFHGYNGIPVEEKSRKRQAMQSHTSQGTDQEYEMEEEDEFLEYNQAESEQEYEEEQEPPKVESKPKVPLKSAPPVMNFNDLLRLAEKKQYEPVEIKVVKKTEERPMTAEELREREFLERKRRKRTPETDARLPPTRRVPSQKEGVGTKLSRGSGDTHPPCKGTVLPHPEKKPRPSPADEKRLHLSSSKSVPGERTKVAPGSCSQSSLHEGRDRPVFNGAGKPHPSTYSPSVPKTSAKGPQKSATEHKAKKSPPHPSHSRPGPMATPHNKAKSPGVRPPGSSSSSAPGRPSTGTARPTVSSGPMPKRQNGSSNSGPERSVSGNRKLTSDFSPPGRTVSGTSGLGRPASSSGGPGRPVSGSSGSGRPVGSSGGPGRPVSSLHDHRRPMSGSGPPGRSISGPGRSVSGPAPAGRPVSSSGPGRPVSSLGPGRTVNTSGPPLKPKCTVVSETISSKNIISRPSNGQMNGMKPSLSGYRSGPQRLPFPSGYKRQREYEEEEDDEEEYDSEMEDFIEDEGEPQEEISKHIREIFGYDRKKYKDESDYALRYMESSWKEQQKEEAKSLRLGMQEDLEEMRREEEEMRRRKAKKLKKR